MSLINVRPNYNFNFLNEIEDTSQTKIGNELSHPLNGSLKDSEAYLYVTGLSGSHVNHEVHLETKQAGVWSSIGNVVGEGSIRYKGLIDDLRYNITVAEGATSASSVHISAVKS